MKKPSAEKISLLSWVSYIYRFLHIFVCFVRKFSYWSDLFFLIENQNNCYIKMKVFNTKIWKNFENVSSFLIFLKYFFSEIVCLVICELA